MIIFALYFHIEIADCIWGSWSEWSTCSKSCGGGTQLHFRRVATYETKGGQCSGESEEEQECNTDICPAGIGLDKMYKHFEEYKIYIIPL